jgi:hypothetical protein
MCFFKKKEEPKKEVKIEPIYEWKYTYIAVDLDLLDSINEQLVKGFVPNIPCHSGIYPREGIVILTKCERILFEENK